MTAPNDSSRSTEEPSAVAKSRSRLPILSEAALWARLSRLGRICLTWWGGVLLQFVVLIVWIFGAKGGPQWFLLVITIGGSSAGLLVGFLYSTYGEETERFKPYYTALSGLVGGAVGADVLRGDQSVLLRSLRSAAAGCGLAHGSVFVALFFLVGFTVGFLGLYYARLFFLNPMSRREEATIEAYQALGRTASTDGDQVVRSAQGLPIDAPTTTAELRAEGAAATVPIASIQNDPTAMATASGAALNLSLRTADGATKTKLADRAVKLAEAAVAHAPGNPGYLQMLGNTLLNQKNYELARNVFEQLARLPNAPVAARKTLAYAMLFLDDYARAERVIDEYLRVEPNDAVAKLTRLSALCGQWRKGERRPGLDDDIVALTSELRRDPTLRERVTMLIGNDAEELSVVRTDAALASKMSAT